MKQSTCFSYFKLTLLLFLFNYFIIKKILETTENTELDEVKCEELRN
jgi:hypothetical protein